MYGSVKCPNVRDLMQAHFRVRHTIDKQVYIVLNCFQTNAYWSKNDVCYKNAQSAINNTNTKIKYITSAKQLMSYTEKQTYDMITNYNHIEDILGYSCYPELFVFLLQHIGYNIETQDINTRSKKN
jgi:protein gp37